ncbi:ribonucleotide-diphosphate reductase subunit alpha [Citrobacter koseri]|uniref:Ribonucleotide-diphosphate reductase subunit alpha n=1 Tax=Citrobacter koseri TaxID=545 RepID=A0A2X2VPU3_CITKO|nr:ribonucleotide-diphosphate reductase subunit alpha [Citrobacter koseri]
MRSPTKRWHYNWEALRESIKTHGLRNSTLSALMPSETSSQISNATNGIEPPRGHVSIKASERWRTAPGWCRITKG